MTESVQRSAASAPARASGQPKTTFGISGPPLPSAACGGGFRRWMRSLSPLPLGGSLAPGRRGCREHAAARPPNVCTCGLSGQRGPLWAYRTEPQRHTDHAAHWTAPCQNSTWSRCYPSRPSDPSHDRMDSPTPYAYSEIAYVGPTINAVPRAFPDDGLTVLAKSRNDDVAAVTATAQAPN